MFHETVVFLSWSPESAFDSHQEDDLSRSAHMKVLIWLGKLEFVGPWFYSVGLDCTSHEDWHASCRGSTPCAGLRMRSNTPGDDNNITSLTI